MKKRLLRSLLALGLVLFTVNLWSQSVLICGAPTDPNWNTDVQSKLLATGQFTTINYFYTQNATPTLADLLAYDAVLHYTDYPPNDPTLLGNNLAAYIDQGGAVVNCVFEYNWGTLAGNFNNYRIASGGSMNNTPVTLGSISTPTHPILSGVNTFFGGSSSYHMTGSTFSANSNIQAYYNDGSWMVATKENVGPMNARRVDLNFYPPSSDARSDFWDASTNGALLMANALTWAMGGSSAIAGCTNPSACNYDAAATSDNGSCTYPVGDPSVFPQDSWNLYAYNGSGFTTYRGFVNIGSNLNINTELLFSEGDTPSNIAGYAGCAVTYDDHAYSIKRQGFPAGNYTFALYMWDDVASVFVNGNQIMNYACCGFWAGSQYYYNLNLDATSTVEVRLQEGEYGSRIHFELISNIAGCTNPSACNYNPAATSNDGSCTFASLYYPDADADGYGDSQAGISGNYTVQSVPFTMETPSMVNQGPICDDCTQYIPIGFDFSFYGVQYSNLTISSNGYVTFENTGNNGCCSGQVIPQYDGIDNAIYLGRSDWYPYTTGLVTYYNLTSPNRLVVQYNSVPRCCDPSASDIMTGQMVIFENGQIQLNISYLNHASNFVTVGVENQQGTLAAGIGQLTPPISLTNTSYLFTYSTGNGGEAVYACTQPAGYVNNNIDCDDAVFTTNPGASEICINGVDDNCSGVADENCPILGCTDATACNFNASANTDDGSCDYGSDYYADLDGDGYGAGSSINACTQPAGYVTNNTDCDDSNPAVNPGAIELCNGNDDDCDTQIDNGLGAPATDLTTDLWIMSFDWYCSGTPSTTNINFDSNGNWNQTTSSVSEGLWNLCGNNFSLNFFNYQTVYTGTFSNGTFSGTMDDMNGGTGCFTMYPANAGCTDPSATNYDPSANINDGSCVYQILGCIDATACNFNASANTDDGSCIYPSTYYVDADGDGYGSYPGLTTQGTSSVVFTADGLVINGSNIANPNGSMNVEGAASFTVPADGTYTFDWSYVTTDVDGPGYDPAYYINGVPVQLTDDQGADSQNGSVSVAVTAGSIFGFSVVAEDNILGQATLTITNFNGIANFVGLQACAQPAGYVSNNDDCNDLNSTVNPGAIEICNANDDDCDGIADDGVVLTTYYQDMDFDGFGGSNSTDACFPPNPSYIVQGGDCEDFNPSVNPGATEVCNASDDNCNSQIDEGLTFVDYYVDLDGDGYGAGSATNACSQPAGMIADNTDCDDSNNAINSAATEICFNSIDDNCNTQVDENCEVLGCTDATACNYDAAANTNDGSCTYPSTYYVDADGDGFGGQSGTVTTQDYGYGQYVNSTFTENHIDIVFPQTMNNLTSFTVSVTNDAGISTNWFYFHDAAGNNVASVEFMPQYGGTINTTYTFPTPLNGITDVSVYSWWNGIYLNDVTFTSTIDATITACTQPAGYVTNNTDCNDGNNAINPNATEICGNGFDDDCDGTTDEVPGDPTAWGQGEWLANVYNGVYFENYQGYYVRQGNGYNTESDFTWGGTPSDAAGYVGCSVPGDFHSVKYRRQGFPTSIYPYAITVPSWDDDVYVYVDGNLVWSTGCCGNGMNNNIVWTGNLTETSTVEVSFGEYGGASFLSFIVEPQYPLSITGSTAISNYACYDFNYYAQVTQSYGVDPSTMTYNVTSANGLIDVAAITPTFNGSEVIFNFSPNSIVGEDIITIAVADNMGFADTLVVNVNLTECPPPLQVFGNTEINVDACTDFNIFVGASSALGYDANSLTYVTTFSDETYVQSTNPNYIDLWGNEAYIYFNASGQMGSTIATTVVTDPLGNSDTLVTLVNFGICSPVMGSNYVDIISCGDSVVTLNFTYAFNVPGVSQSVGSISSSNTNAVPNENIVFVSAEPTTVFNNGITYYGTTYTYEVTFANLGQWTEINGYMQDDYNFNNNFWYSMESVIDDSAPQLSADFATIDITLPSGVCDTIISWDELVNPVNAFGTNSTYITNQHAGTFYAAINGGSGLTTLGVDGNSGADCSNGYVADGHFTISTADGSSFEVYYSNTLNTYDPSLYQMWFVPVTETAVTTNIDYAICDHTFILENLSGAPQSYFYYLFASQINTVYGETVLQSVAQEVANNFSGYMSTPNGTFDLTGLSASMSGVVNSVNATILNDGNYYAINNDYVTDDNGFDVGISDGGNDIYDGGNYLTTNFNDYYGNGEQGGGIPYTNGVVALGGPISSDALFSLSITEACDYTMTSSIANGSAIGVGTTVIDFEATDNSGNITTYSVTLNVISEGIEVCNNIDDNCNSQIDEGLAFNNYYADADGDGYGAGNVVSACSQPAGYVTTNTDCNDALAAVNPSVTENCSTSYDDNCNGVANEGCVTNLPGENPSNAISVATSVWPNCFSNVNSTLVGMSPSANAQTVCLTGEDKWYQFVATTEGVSILVNSTQNDILIELQTAAGTLVAQENAVAGIGTEILNHFGLTAGQVYKVGIRNYDSSLGIGTFSACVRMLKRGGCDSGVSPNWSNTLSLCQVFKATWPGSGSSVRFTFTGLTGTGAGNVYTKTQSGASADQLILATVTPTLPYGTLYNVLITNIYTLQDGAGNNEVMEVPALTPCTLNTIAEPVTQLRASDNCSSGPRFRSAVVASLPWVCGTVNWRWEFVEVDGSNNPVGLPIYHLRNAASNYLNLGTVSALQYGKTYRVRTCPILTYTGTNYNWGPAQYMCIIGQSGMAPEVQVNRNNDLVDNSANVNIYPNPTNGSDINIQLSNITSENVQVRVLDAMGRVVFANRYAVDGMFTTNMTFDRPLANGLYMIETSFNGEVITQRMMVQK